MKLRVSHLTRYEYEQPVSFSPHTLYLRPRESVSLRLGRFSFNISPSAKLFPVRDAWDNNHVRAHFWDGGAALSIRSEFEIETGEVNPFDFVLSSKAVQSPFDYEPSEVVALTPYLTLQRDVDRARLRQWLDEYLIQRPAETVPLLTAINQLVYASLAYENRSDATVQAPMVTLDRRCGTYRDFATLLVELARILGYAARYVSGYLYSYPEDDHRHQGAMHGWAEIYLPGAGWKGFDPTHGILCNDCFIPVAHAARAEWVGPVQGAYYSSQRVASTLTTRVLVEKV